MSCKDWKIKISAHLDGVLPETDRERLFQHLETCPECRNFYEEMSVLSNLIAAGANGKEPSPFLWYKIERGIAEAGENSRRPSGWELIRLPRAAYAAASIVVMITLAALLQLGGPSSSERQQLAEIDAYHIELRGNPFLEEIDNSDRNPFFNYNPEAVNPFASNLKENK